MSGASIEETLELWAASLREVKARMRPLFTQERVAMSAGLFLDGLLGEERRKTGWMRAEAAGDPGPWRQQAILGRGRWDADALRDIVREYVVETLAVADAVLVLDETGFLKQGKASCGVVRQYTGSAGKITNCQIGVFVAYVSDKGHAFIDRALYLPRAWADDPVPSSAGTGMETLVAVEGRRWAIEDSFETAKTELGHDHNETRSWHGWHRHVSLVMLAFAMLAAIRHRANAAAPPKTLIGLARTCRTSSADRSRRSAASRSGSRSDASGPPTSSPGRSGDGRTKPPRATHT